MIANPCATSTRLNRTPRANVLILLFLSASFVPWKVQIVTRSGNQTPPVNGMGKKHRDNTCEEIGNNGRAQHVHSTNGTEDTKFGPQCPSFYTTRPPATFALEFSN